MTNQQILNLADDLVSERFNNPKKDRLLVGYWKSGFLDGYRSAIGLPIEESKKSARKSLRESNLPNKVYDVLNELASNFLLDYDEFVEFERNGLEHHFDKIRELGAKLKKADMKGDYDLYKKIADEIVTVVKRANGTLNESKKSAKKSIKESSDVAEGISSEIDKSYWINKLIDGLDKHYESMEKAWLKNLDELSDEDILDIVDDCMGKSKTLVGKSEMLKNKMIDDLSKAYDDYIDDIDRQIRIGKSEDEIKEMIETTLENDIKMYIKLAYNNKASSNYFMVKFAEDNLI